MTEPLLRTSPDAAAVDRFAAASGDAHPIHVDDAAARAAGLPGRIAHGAWTMALAARAAIAEAGGDMRALRSLEARFVAPVVLGADVVVRREQPPADGCVLALSVVQNSHEVLGGVRAELRAPRRPQEDR